jgi:hypothetical protein
MLPACEKGSKSFKKEYREKRDHEDDADIQTKCGNGNRVVFHNRGSAPQVCARVAPRILATKSALARALSDERSLFCETEIIDRFASKAVASTSRSVSAVSLMRIAWSYTSRKYGLVSSGISCRRSFRSLHFLFLLGFFLFERR